MSQKKEDPNKMVGEKKNKETDGNRTNKNEKEGEVRKTKKL